MEEKSWLALLFCISGVRAIGYGRLTAIKPLTMLQIQVLQDNNLTTKHYGVLLATYFKFLNILALRKPFLFLLGTSFLATASLMA